MLNPIAFFHNVTISDTSHYPFIRMALLSSEPGYILHQVWAKELLQEDIGIRQPPRRRTGPPRTTKTPGKTSVLLKPWVCAVCICCLIHSWISWFALNPRIIISSFRRDIPETAWDTQKQTNKKKNLLVITIISRHLVFCGSLVSS